MGHLLPHQPSGSLTQASWYKPFALTAVTESSASPPHSLRLLLPQLPSAKDTWDCTWIPKDHLELGLHLQTLSLFTSAQMLLIQSHAQGSRDERQAFLGSLFGLHKGQEPSHKTRGRVSVWGGAWDDVFNAVFSGTRPGLCAQSTARPRLLLTIFSGLMPLTQRTAPSDRLRCQPRKMLGDHAFYTTGSSRG